MGVIIDEGIIGMKKSLASVIQYMVNSFGFDIMEDDSRFWAIFLDLSPEMNRERKMIKRICDEHLLSRFWGMTHVSKNEYASVVSSLRSELTVNQGFSDLWANDLIDAFCEGLGIEYKIYPMFTPKVEVSPAPIDLKVTEREYIIRNFFPDSKVKAIIYFREQTGTGLKEAKDFVDEIWINAESKMRSPGWLNSLGQNSFAVQHIDITQFLLQNFYPDSKVKAIKYYREQTETGLKEAKEYVDNIWDEKTHLRVDSIQLQNTNSSIYEIKHETKLNQYILNNFYPDSKVKAIKYYREQTGLGLAEAKAVVDKLWK